MSDDERFDSGVEEILSVVTYVDGGETEVSSLYLMKNGTVRWKLED